MTLSEFLKDKTLPVRIRESDWRENSYLEVLCAGNNMCLARDECGIEDAYFLSNKSNWQLYEEPKQKKKHVMYRHWYLNAIGDLIKYDSECTWEEIKQTESGCFESINFLETEIIKEFEV